jgi:hypothetical protein
MKGNLSSSVVPANKNIILFSNDLIDSDNWAAAWAVAVAAMGDASTEVIWIVEPRKVALGLSMTSAQLGKCLELVSKYFPGRGKALKVMVGALLSVSDVEDLEGVTEEERSLVCMTLGRFRLLLPSLPRLS